MLDRVGCSFGREFLRHGIVESDLSRGGMDAVLLVLMLAAIKSIGGPRPCSVYGHGSRKTAGVFFCGNKWRASVIREKNTGIYLDFSPPSSRLDPHALHSTTKASKLVWEYVTVQNK